MLAAYRLLAAFGHRLPAPASLRTSLAARRGAAERWVAWASTTRGHEPLVWAHAASVGEQQVLEPVLERLARARPEPRIVLTHTSPSVSPTVAPAGVCHRDFLPWDEPRGITTALDAVRPAVLLFGRGDLWPELVLAGAARGIPIVVAGATVRPASARLWPVARFGLREMYRHVTWLGAVTPDDADRWVRLGVPATRIVVSGDPRHDRMIERLADVGPALALRRWAGEDPVLVAGSVEPSDDGVLVEALSRLAGTLPNLRTVLVPHDVTETRVGVLHRMLARHGLDTGIVTGTERGAALPKARTLIAALRGRLADLYLGADLAYVGGGFRRGHLHAVAEPGALGLPVIIGPRWQGTTDAREMVAAGGAIAITGGDGRTLADVLPRLATDPADRSRRGLAARSVLTAGAARMTAEAVLERMTG